MRTIWFLRCCFQGGNRGTEHTAGIRWSRAVPLLAAILAISAIEGSAQKRRPFPSAFASPSLQGVANTASQRAVFAPFLAATCIVSDCPTGELNTALSITNTLFGPAGVHETYETLFNDLQGTVQLYLWDGFGHLLFYETQAGSPGVGLIQEPGREGFLAPGQTWRVLLSQILDEVDYTQHEIDFGHVEGVFAGYLWVVANFDGVQGTTNLTDFSTFTQSLVMQPDLGTTFFDFDASAGVPLVQPTEPPTGCCQLSSSCASGTTEADCLGQADALEWLEGGLCERVSASCVAVPSSAGGSR